MLYSYVVFIMNISDTLTYEDLEFHEKIGIGSHSTVFSATIKTGSYKGFTDVAVKSLHRQDEMEVAIMEALKPHPNIVTFLAYVYLRPIFFIVMEKCEYSLWKYLYDFHKKPTKARCQEWLRQSAEAVSYLHENDVVHRDICTKNCLLTAHDILKIGDFGISKIADVTEDTTQAAGYRLYIAPEVIREKKFSKASDIYSLGFLFWEIHTKEMPKTILNATNVEEFFRDRHSISNNMKDLLISCWERDYHDRPKIKEVLKQVTDA